MVVTQTEVASLRRMDVAVREADAPETSSLTTVTGFYGTAIGAAGGGLLNWSRQEGPPADDGEDGDEQPPPDDPVDPEPPPEDDVNEDAE